MDPTIYNSAVCSRKLIPAIEVEFRWVVTPNLLSPSKALFTKKLYETQSTKSMVHVLGGINVRAVKLRHMLHSISTLSLEIGSVKAYMQRMCVPVVANLDRLIRSILAPIWFQRDTSSRVAPLVALCQDPGQPVNGRSYFMLCFHIEEWNRVPSCH